jgi:hypothetical protein
MQTKEARIAELKKQILEIENEKDYNFALVQITPDCGGGIADRRETIAISNDQMELVSYCQKEYNYTPKFKREKDGLKPCDKWYMLDYTQIQIMCIPEMKGGIMNA